MKKMNQIDERMLENINGGADEGCIGVVNIDVDVYNNLVGANYKSIRPKVGEKVEFSNGEDLLNFGMNVINPLTSLASSTSNFLNDVFGAAAKNCGIMPDLTSLK